jgi:hypothetical protein
MNDTQLVLRQELKQVVLRGGPFVMNILPFTAVATVNNQTVFQLLNAQGQPLIFSQIICLFIMGSGQNPLTSDYTLSNNILGTVATLSQGISLGYTVYGAGQV